MRILKLKNVIAAVLIGLLFVISPSVVRAEGRTAKDYMADGIRAAYDNMHLIYQAYYDDEGSLEEQPGGFVAVYQEWDKDWNLISRTYLDKNCEPIQLQSPYIFWNVKFDEDGWSEWMKPKPDTENQCFTIGYADLGDRTVGDQYECLVEVEFADVEATEDQSFWFRAQGAVDGSWGIGNVWNDGLASVREVPADNTFTYSTVSTITESNEKAITFDLGFRCDYWTSGKFRVRNVEIVKE